MMKTLRLMSKIFIFLLLISSCKKTKQEELITILTNDSMSMWNVTMQTYIELKDTTYYHDYYKSLMFTKDLICEQYSLLYSGKRDISIIGSTSYSMGYCNKWEILNDSTIKIMCTEVFVIKKINKDTVYLYDLDGFKAHEMYRVSPPWNISMD